MLWHSPFEKKDTLKEHGFKWNAPETVWQKEVVGEDLKNTAQTQLSEIYHGGDMLSEAITVDTTQRFL